MTTDAKLVIVAIQPSGAVLVGWMSVISMLTRQLLGIVVDQLKKRMRAQLD